MTLTMIAYMTALSTALVFAGGACWGMSLPVAGLALSGLGCAWLGVLYSTLLRMASEPRSAGPDLDHSTLN